MIGKTLAQYEVTALIGKGGMGEVYRARDTKLGREVALKVLPEELSGDPERSARFDREARTLASLQHANVASIYGFENVDGVRFLAMELVEGHNLEQRILEGSVPHDEFLRIARQMALGLEAAHDKGIVHRDLKPANVMLTRDGDVKILDFGLARAWFGDNSDESDIAASPTITAAMTQAGTILGTAAYMAPEQARGKNVDRRADIWAFGVILWEMITGSRLFEGETVSDTLAAVLRAEPDWEKLPAEEQPMVCRLIERCLVRDPRQRLRDIGEARILLQEGGSGETQLSMLGAPAAQASTAAADPKSNWLPMLILAVLFSALGAGIGWKLLASSPEPQLLHLMIPSPEGAEFDLDGSSPGSAVISPDGTAVVFTARADNVTLLYLRHLDRGESVALSGTDGAAYPFWSPDGEHVGFFTPSVDNKLKKLSISGGPPVSLCPANNGKGGTWNEEGTILFAPDHGSPIHRVSSIGGVPEAITELAETENSHRHPRFLPNGVDFLFLARTSGANDAQDIRLGSLNGGDARTIATSQSQAEYSAGHLLTMSENVLMATKFDLDTGELVGGPTPLTEDLLLIGSNAAAASYSVSRSGMLTYQTGFAMSDRIMDWYTLEDGTTAQLETKGQIYYPILSPDGTRCVVTVFGESQNGSDLSLVDLESGRRTRLSFDQGSERFPCWTPDGRSVVYTSNSEGMFRILMQSLDGVGGAITIYESESEIQTQSISPDGASVFVDVRVDRNIDVLLVPLDGTSDPVEFLSNPEREGGCVSSPNGRWVAYHAETDGGEWHVYVVPMAGGSRKWQVTTQQAIWPTWSADGSELFVSAFDGAIRAFQVDTEGESFAIGASRAAGVSELPGANGKSFAVHPDGKRVLRVGPDPTSLAEISHIHLVTDWQRGLMR